MRKLNGCSEFLNQSQTESNWINHIYFNWSDILWTFLTCLLVPIDRSIYPVVLLVPKIGHILVKHVPSMVLWPFPVHLQCKTGWWFQPTPLKNDGVSSSVGWHSIPNFSWKVIKFHGSSHHQPVIPWQFRNDGFRVIPSTASTGQVCHAPHAPLSTRQRSWDHCSPTGSNRLHWPSTLRSAAGTSWMVLWLIWDGGMFADLC